MILQFVFAALVANPQAKGLEVAQKIDAANVGFKSEKSSMEMKLVNAHGDETLRRMTSIVQELRSDGDRSKIEFLWPADVKGTRMLTWSHKKGNDDQWLFLPALSRVKRISSRSKTGSFMGSEFSYEDLGSQEIEKFSYTFVAEEKIAGRKVWVLDRVPTDKKSGYSRQRTYSDQGYMNPVKIEYFDRKGDLLKTATFLNYKKHGKFWRAGQITMINHQTKKKSFLTWSDRQLGIAVEEGDFDSDSLED